METDPITTKLQNVLNDHTKLINVTNGNATDAPTEASNEDNTDTLVYTITLYFCFYFVVVLVFCILRKHYGRLFNIRSWVPELKCDLATKDYGYVSWIWEVFQVSDDDMFEQCGMDAHCYIRILAFGRKMALLGCFNAIWLLPIYFTAPKDEITKDIEYWYVWLTASNLPKGSTRFIGTIIATYINYIYTMILIVKEFEWYTKYRHKFRTQTKPRNYAVYVSGIPEAYQSTRALRNYFQNCSSSSSILEAHIARDLPKLEGKVAQRDNVISALEHAYAYERLSGKRKEKYKIGYKGISKVECIQEYEDELNKLNDEISQSIQEVMELNSAHYRTQTMLQFKTQSEAMTRLRDNQVDLERNLIVNESPKDDNHRYSKRSSLFNESFDDVDGNTHNESTSRHEEDDKLPSEPANYDTREAWYKEEAKEKKVASKNVDQIREAIGIEQENNKDFQESVGDKEVAQCQSRKIPLESMQKALSEVVGAKAIESAAKNISERFATVGEEGAKQAKRIGAELLSATNAVVSLNLNSEGMSKEAGFVVFSNLYATNVALQMIHHSKPGVMEVSEAPNPEDIFWKNVGLPGSAKRTGQMISAAATTALCLFWTIPIAFIVSLTEVDSLKETVPALGNLIENHPNFEPWAARASPLLLVLLQDGVLPCILSYFATMEGHVSSPVLEASLFIKLAAFMVRYTPFLDKFLTLVSK